VTIAPGLIVAGMAIGIGTSVIAAWIPARSASRVDPVQALQKGKYQVLSAGENRSRRWMALLGFLVALGCLIPSSSKPIFYIGCILMNVTGLLLAPTLTLLLSKLFRPILKVIL